MGGSIGTIAATLAENAVALGCVAAGCFVAGLSFAGFASGLNKEGKKKGFRGKRLHGIEKEIDEELGREYEEGLAGKSPLLRDEQEHHSSKKFL